MRKLAVMKSERLQAAGSMNRCSSAMAPMITSGCSWNTDSCPSRILMLVFMSQQVGSSFVLTTKIQSFFFFFFLTPSEDVDFLKF